MTSSEARPGRDVLLLAEDARSAQHLAHQWALANAGSNANAVLVHTNRRALRGLPSTVRQAHLGPGPAGTDLAPARRVIGALESHPVVIKALPEVGLVVAPNGKSAPVSKALRGRAVDVVEWSAFERGLREQRLRTLLREQPRTTAGRGGLAVLIDEALDEPERSAGLVAEIASAAGGLLGASGYPLIRDLAPRFATLPGKQRTDSGLEAIERISEISLGSGPQPADATVARGVFDAAADRVDAGDLTGAVRLVTLGLRLVFHSELHADGERSLLVADPHTVLAPWRESRFAREVLAARPPSAMASGASGRSADRAGRTGESGHDDNGVTRDPDFAGPASGQAGPNAARPGSVDIRSGDVRSGEPGLDSDEARGGAAGPRIVVLAGAYGSFYRPIVELLTRAGHAPDLVRADELGPLLGRRDPTDQLVGEWLRLRDPARWSSLPEDTGAARQLAVLRDRLANADVVFADWCDPGALFASYLAPENARLIIRVHRVDATKAWAQLVDWSRVERVLLVSDHVRDFFAPQLAAPGEPLPTRLTVVNNIIDVERYRRPKTPGAERRIAMVGWGRRVKDPIFAVEILRELLRDNPSWRLHLIGRDFADSGLTPVADYLERFRELTADAALREAIVWVGFTGRLEEALDECGFALSTSTVEGWPVGVVEAAVSGCIPVIRDWPQVAAMGGARAIYADTPEWVVASPAEGAARIRSYADPTAWAAESARCRDAADRLTAAGATEAEVLSLILGRP